MTACKQLCLKHPKREKVNKNENYFLATCFFFVSNSINKVVGNGKPSRHELTPAGADDHPLTGGGVGDGAVVVDQGGVKGHTINV